MYKNRISRLSDSELLTLVAQGNCEASDILDRRYYNYCKVIAKNFLENRTDYGFSFGDFLSTSMLGYFKARQKFSYESSDAFFPYFKIYAQSEMSQLLEEGSHFYLNENPKNFVSLDITYKANDDPLSLGETIGTNDDKILDEIKIQEFKEIVENTDNHLTSCEMEILLSLISKLSVREIREKLHLSYSAFRNRITSIRNKIGHKLMRILK